MLLNKFSPSEDSDSKVDVVSISDNYRIAANGANFRIIQIGKHCLKFFKYLKI